MTGPAGFTPLDGGWGRSWPGAWHRSAGHGIWHNLYQDRTDGSWSAAVHLDAPHTAVGRTCPDGLRRHPDWWAPDPFPDVDAAAAFLAAHATPTTVADALQTGGLVPPPRVRGTDPAQAVLDAVAVLVVDGQTVRAAAVVDGVRGASPRAADRLTRLAARAGLPLPGPQVVRAVDLADVVALLTRTISSDLGLARARRWATRWLATADEPALRSALTAVVATASPRDNAAAVAAWQARLERVRAGVVAAAGNAWPGALPDVGRDLVPLRASLPVPLMPPPPLADRAFEQHAGFCPAGRPPDGRPRVDLFFDYGAFPVWWNGGGGMASPQTLGMPDDLAADLWSWSQSHDRRAVPGGRSRPADAVARYEVARLRVLAGRLERTAGVAAVVQQHRGRGDGCCPTDRCLGPTTSGSGSAARLPSTA